MTNNKGIIGFGIIGNRCDFKGCEATADSIFRHRDTGTVVSARCRKHDTVSRRAALDRGDCPTCQLSRDSHHDEDENTYTCDLAIERATAMAEFAAENGR